MTTEEMKTEAVERLEYLRKRGLMYDPVRAFKAKKTELWYSDRVLLVLAVFYLNSERITASIPIGLKP